jgi:hypothetical protein
MLNEAVSCDVRGSGGITPSFLTSVLDGGEWSASRLGRFTPGERASIPIGKNAKWAPEPVWALENLEFEDLAGVPIATSFLAFVS